MTALSTSSHGIVADDGWLRRGLTAGALTLDPLARGPRSGRARRWSYAAAADAHLAIGAAIVDLGFVAAAFVWCHDGADLRTWERRSPLGLSASVGPDPATCARFERGGSLRIGPGGSLRVDVPTGRGRLDARLALGGHVVPATLVTDTSAGGWNVTEKAAGYRVIGAVTVDGTSHELDGAGWRDWTAGRQDHRTAWRWAAGTGVGGGVGLNVSTGMNADGDGEDVVWWDGEPFPLEVEVLTPVRGPDGPWRLAGPDWELRFEPVAVRAADERLLIMRSRYVQPVGRFTGTLPGPDGAPVPVELRGVTEAHEARW